MASGWWNVTREGDEGLPTMLVQAISAATALCVGELLCAPIYVALVGGKVALVPWALTACLLSVAFVYTVGFALLWCVEGLMRNGTPRWRPLIGGVAGLIGFGFWGRFVIAAFLDSLRVPLGLSPLGLGPIVTVVINSAVLGFAAFFLGYIAPKALAKRRATVIVMGVATVVLAIAGGYYLSRMYAVLY
ncbi:hypothetical protein [Bifidobacterium mongoliense]|uniref:Cadmium transporter n=2 Tax=Bifidobacterium mongoliense TaxID=518643 RepID=A0A087C0Z0_9BIFI|nr:hypothetical protein [Bifidobacterium mongoliense]KFI76940.1 cadmium transporter [Bifidobacterium mongoliense DSM 21395]MDN5632699.1 hypothetical protein [Bifidobacterium mongoliense]MDN5979724.1 hypothetical protein [Bifidobacterium mongoliense]MDN6017046.1 hypothetical protein [Bifidobacterium mongoliense]MDN6025552.1 hypothetical protein [Bifidobacterium mongoliense]